MRYDDLLRVVVWILAFLFVISAHAQSPKHKMTVEKASAKYASLGDDWKAKRAFCLELIDQEVISRGRPINEILMVFKKDAVRISGDPSSNCFITVLFEKQMEPPTDDAVAVAVGYVGWYLHIGSGIDGRVDRYSLSNTHK